MQITHANHARFIFSQYGLPSKIISDVGTNFISEKFEDICKRLSIHHAVALSYKHQGNRQVEACIKFVKRSIENVKRLMQIYFLQIRAISISNG